MDEVRIEAIATRAAKVAIVDLFEIMGADLTTPAGRKAAQENWLWVTDTRRGSTFVRRTVWGAAIVASIGGLWVLITKIAAFALTAVK